MHNLSPSVAGSEGSEHVAPDRTQDSNGFLRSRQSARAQNKRMILPQILLSLQISAERSPPQLRPAIQYAYNKR